MRKTSRLMTTAAAAAVAILALANPAQAATVQASWNMNTLTSNRMVDSTGNPYNHGTATDVKLVSGAYYSFNGTSSIVQVAHQDNLNPGAANITVEARVNVRSLPSGTYDIIRKGTSGTGGGYYKIEIKETSTGMNAACIFKDQAGNVGRAIYPIKIASWVTITCKKTASSVTLLLNGAVVRTTTIQVGTISNTAGVFIGGKGDGSDVFDGLMDHARIITG